MDNREFMDDSQRGGGGGGIGVAAAWTPDTIVSHFVLKATL